MKPLFPFIICLAVAAHVCCAQSSGLHPIEAGGLWGFINSRGRTLIAPQFSRAGEFLNGLASVEKDDKWGLIDGTGQFVVTNRFATSIRCSSEGRFLTRTSASGSKWSFVGNDGTYLTDSRFDQANCYSEGVAAVAQDGKWFYVDLDGKQAFEGQFDQAASFHEGLARVGIGAGFGYINHKGTVVIAPHFQDARDFCEGTAAVAEGGNGKVKWGFIDKQGIMAIRPLFDQVGDFSEGLVAVKQGFLWGFANSSGELVIFPKYAAADSFSLGLAAVASNESWGTLGYIDSHGIMRIPPRFATARRFSKDGLARVELRNEPTRGAPGATDSGFFEYINTSGIVIWSNRPGRKSPLTSRGSTVL